MRRHRSAAQPVQIARQAMDTAREAAQNVDLSALRDTVSAQAANAAAAAQNVDLAAVRETVVDEVTKDYDLVLDETRRRPLRSLLLALGLGAVVGAAVDHWARRRKPQEPQQQKSAWGPPAS